MKKKNHGSLLLVILLIFGCSEKEPVRIHHKPPLINNQNDLLKNRLEETNTNMDSLVRILKLKKDIVDRYEFLLRKLEKGYSILAYDRCLNDWNLYQEELAEDLNDNFPSKYLIPFSDQSSFNEQLLLIDSLRAYLYTH